MGNFNEDSVKPHARGLFALHRDLIGVLQGISAIIVINPCRSHFTNFEILKMIQMIVNSLTYGHPVNTKSQTSCSAAGMLNIFLQQKMILLHFIKCIKM